MNLFSLYQDTTGNSGYITKTLSGMSLIFERDMHRFRYAKTTLKKTRLTLCNQLSPLSKISLVPYRIPSSLTRWVRKVTAWQAQEYQNTSRTSKNEEFTHMYRYYRWSLTSSLWLGFLAVSSFQKFNLKLLKKNSSKAEL